MLDSPLKKNELLWIVYTIEFNTTFNFQAHMVICSLQFVSQYIVFTILSSTGGWKGFLPSVFQKRWFKKKINLLQQR